MIGHCDKFRTEILHAQEIKLKEFEYAMEFFARDPLLDEEEKEAFNKMWWALNDVNVALHTIVRKSKEGEI